MVLVGSPPCTMMYILQILSLAKHGHDPAWMEAYIKKVEEAREHIKFCCKLYRLHAEAERYWVHEHPWPARSLRLAEIEEPSEDPRVCLVQAHQCRFGQTTDSMNDDKGLMPVKKPIGFLTNCWCIAEELDKTCEGGRVHGWLLSGRAAGAAKYPEGLCEAICKGIPTQKVHDRLYGTLGLYLVGNNTVGAIND